MELTASQLADHLGAELRGDGNLVIRGVAALAAASSEQVAFLSDPAYQKDLAVTAAGAVIIKPELADQVTGVALITDNPYLAFARTTQLFDNRPAPSRSIHPTAVIEEGAVIGENVSIGPNAVIGRRTVIGADTEIGACCVVGDDCVIGDNCILNPNVTLYYQVTLGHRVRVQSGTVIGADGFGYAPDQGRWERIAQLGGVRIGNDVEIGSNTCIDRGALGDTVIADNVILDNLIQIAHNCEIGEGTAMAGCVGLAGSTKVGKHCTIAGGAGLAGHMSLADGVHIMGMTLVTNSIDEPGVYASGTSHMPAKQWRRNAARFKQLDSIAKRLQKLEKSQEGNA